MPPRKRYASPEPRRNRATSIVLALLVLLTVAGIWRWVGQRSKPLPITADLHVLQGQAIVTRADAGDDPPYVAGASTRLQRGDRVHLASEAQGELVFGEGEVMTLSDGAELLIQELHRSPLARSLVAMLALESGKTYTRLRHLQQDMQFTLETRIATVQVGSTAFACDVLSKDHIWVAVHQGAVTVSMGEQSLPLQAGQGVDVRLGQPLTLTGAPPAPTALPIASPIEPAAPTPLSAAPTATLTELQQTLFPPARTPTRPGDDLVTYTVQPGDTLYSIAQRYGLSWEALWQANKVALPQPEQLRAGQKLIIPLPRPAP